ISIIRSSPVWGTGLNTYGRILKKDPNIKNQWYAHNSYLQTWAETGIIGLAALLGLFIVLLRHSACQTPLMNEMYLQTLAQGCTAGLFGYWVQSFFDNTFFSVQLSVLMWLMMGLLVSTIQSNLMHKTP